MLWTKFTDDCDEVALDISGAYEVKSLKSLIRKFTFNRKTKAFVVFDCVEFSEPTDFEEAYTTFKGAKFGEVSVVVVSKGGGDMVQSVEHIDNPGRISPERHSVRFASPVTSVEITFNFKAKPRKDKKK